MKKVFVPQIPHRYDAATQAHVPAINIGPASEHGDVIIMMPPMANFFATGDLVKQMREHLQYYDYEAGDALVALGDPTLIAVASAILGKMFSNFIILKWDRRMARYFPTHIKV